LSDPLHRRELLFTYPGRCLTATIERIEAVTRGARTRDFRIELKVESPPAPQTYRLNNMSWEEMTDLAIRVSLFGEANPLGLMSSQAEVANPFPDLERAGVSEEALRPLGQVLLTEILVVQRGIQRITKFRLGRPVAGNRALKLEWLPRREYANQPPPEPHALEGELRT
jgi:hypothetical protein